jgi:hypothetical protein
MCKRIVLEGICFYKEKCAYNHKKILHGQTVNDDAIQEDVKNLKTEVEFLKNTINSLVSIREECNIIENSVKDIKKEIKMLKTKNKEVEKRIKLIEDDLTDESEDESDRMEGQQTFKGHVKKTDLKLKCSKCEFCTKSEVQLKKHKNTNHSNEQVYACNICNEGFDKDTEIKKHIEEKHSEIIIQITNNLVESEKRKFNDDSMTTLSDNDQSVNDNSEDDEAFLARFDEDGRFIG